VPSEEITLWMDKCLSARSLNGRAHVFKNKKVYREKEVCFLKNQTIDFCNISMTITTKIY
jgi:hypothetical protein